MKIAVLGGDGYCGWATALYLSRKGIRLQSSITLRRRQWDHELGAQTLTPIRPLPERLRSGRNSPGNTIESFVGDITDYDFVTSIVKSFEPEADRPFRRAALGSLLDDRPQARASSPR